MRGFYRRSGELFSDVDVEHRIRADHPLRTIKAIVDEALESLCGEFDALYAARTGSSVDPAGDAATEPCCCSRSSWSAPSAS